MYHKAVQRLTVVHHTVWAIVLPFHFQSMSIGRFKSFYNLSYLSMLGTINFCRSKLDNKSTRKVYLQYVKKTSKIRISNVYSMVAAIFNFCYFERWMCRFVRRKIRL